MSKPFAFFIRTATAAVIASLVFTSSQVFAQNVSNTWDANADGNWTDVLNWAGDTEYASGADNTATLGDFIDANRIINLDSGITIGNITAADTSNNYTISGANVLTMNVTTGTPTIDVPTAARTLTISSQISGNNGLQKNGAGTLALSGANDYTGGTTISAGAVSISNATAFGAGSVSITGDARINAAALTYTNAIDIDATRILTLGTTGAASSTSTFSGAITGGGSITLAQGVNSSTVVNLSSTSNTFTGNITLPTATLTNDFINFASIGDGGSIIFGRASWLANVRYTGAADLEFNTRNIALATTFGNAGGYDGGGNPTHMFENNGAGTVTINTAMQMTSTTTSGIFFLGGSNAGNNTFAGAIGDPTGANTLGIGKWGTGKWILSNNTNSFEGNVILADGTLSVSDIDLVANDQALGKGSLIRMGYRTAQTGTLEYTGAANAVTDKQIQVGEPSRANNGNFRGGGVIVNNGDGTLTFSSPTFNSTAGVVGTGTGHVRTLTLGGTNTGNNTISGTIQNNNTAIGALVSVTKTGVGTWVLAGDSTYTGATTVSDGTLVVDGSLGATAVTVNGGAFGGSGAIGSTLNLASGSSFYVSDLIDPLQVAGTVTIYAGFGVDDLTGIDDWSLVADGTYTLINGTLGAGVFAGLANNSEGTAFDIGGGRSAYFQEGSLQLIVVPEPSTLVILGAGAAFLGLRFARRRS
jgi:fibronectin-binding autotransporter adhesin